MTSPSTAPATAASQQQPGARRSDGRGRRALAAVVRWGSGAVTAAVLTGFALLLVTGEYANDGPVVLSLTPGHGLHEGDLFVLAGWAVAVLALLVALLVPRRGR